MESAAVVTWTCLAGSAGDGPDWGLYRYHTTGQRTGGSTEAKLLQHFLSSKVPSPSMVTEVTTVSGETVWIWSSSGENGYAAVFWMERRVPSWHAITAEFPRPHTHRRYLMDLMESHMISIRNGIRIEWIAPLCTSPALNLKTARAWSIKEAANLLLRSCQGVAETRLEGTPWLDR